MAITFVRHTTPRVEPGTCYGRTDLDVQDAFLEEAAIVLGALPPAERIVSSPLRRCRLLAEYLSRETGAVLETDDRVIEMDFGSWEGVPWSDIPRPELDAWARDFINARPHGGESVGMLRRRTMEAVTDIRGSSLSTLVVSHAGVIKAAASQGDGASHFQTQVDFGGHLILSE